MAEVSVATRRPIRSSFDLWSGVPASEIVGSATTCDSIKQQRHSLQVDPQISLQLSCGSGLSDGSSFSQGELSPEAAELLMLMQAQQQLAEGDDAPSADEIGIDAQIQRLMQLKQFLRRSKQQQQQQVILEDIALASQSAIDNTTSALFTSSALTTPLQSERWVLPAFFGTCKALGLSLSSEPGYQAGSLGFRSSQLAVEPSRCLVWALYYSHPQPRPSRCLPALLLPLQPAQRVNS